MLCAGIGATWPLTSAALVLHAALHDGKGRTCWLLWPLVLGPACLSEGGDCCCGCNQDTHLCAVLLWIPTQQQSCSLVLVAAPGRNSLAVGSSASSSVGTVLRLPVSRARHVACSHRCLAPSCGAAAAHPADINHALASDMAMCPSSLPGRNGCGATAAQPPPACWAIPMVQSAEGRGLGRAGRQAGTLVAKVCRSLSLVPAMQL